MTITGETPTQIIARIKAENQKCRTCGKPVKKRYGILRTYCSKNCVDNTKIKPGMI